MRSSIQTVLRLLVAKWDLGLLLVLSGLMIGAFFVLLIPQPRYALKLSETPLPPVESVSPMAMISQPTTAELDEAPEKAKFATQKKSHPKKGPKSIPIVYLNKAGLQDLDELPGVGPKLAQRILDYRRGVGRFNAVEELLGVKGIGPRNYTKMKPYLRL